MGPPRTASPPVCALPTYVLLDHIYPLTIPNLLNNSTHSSPTRSDCRPPHRIHSAHAFRLCSPHPPRVRPSLAPSRTQRSNSVQHTRPSALRTSSPALLPESRECRTTHGCGPHSVLIVIDVDAIVCQVSDQIRHFSALPRPIRSYLTLTGTVELSASSAAVLATIDVGCKFRPRTRFH